MEEKQKVFGYARTSTREQNEDRQIIAKGKEPSYERWAKKYNIKNLDKALIFFQENDVRTYEELAKRAVDSFQRFSEKNDSIFLKFHKKINFDILSGDF